MVMASQYHASYLRFLISLHFCIITSTAHGELLRCWARQHMDQDECPNECQITANINKQSSQMYVEITFASEKGHDIAMHWLVTHPSGVNIADSQ